MITTREAWPEEFDRIKEFFQSTEYKLAIRQTDSVIVAEDDGMLCGMTRLRVEHGSLVLQGIRVVEGYSEEDVGGFMLDTLVSVIGDRECFCISQRYQRYFYRQIGFLEIDPVAAPPFLSERYADYRHGGLDVIILCKASTREISDATSVTRPGAKI